MKAIVVKTHGYGEKLMIYKFGGLIEAIVIDRTFYGPEWCENHGMTITETVESDTGETFEIWRRANELACAIPVREKGE